MSEFIELLNTAYHKGATDIHLQSNTLPVMRCNGTLERLGKKLVTSFEIDNIAKTILSNDEFNELKVKGDIDKGIVFDGVSCRLNIFYTSGTLAIACRILPLSIPSMDKIKLPFPFQRLINDKHGLVIVSGPTGSGKSTTIAAMLNEINKTQRKHIITIEQPVEYRLLNDASLIAQREVGQDCKDFAAGLKAALREDPDIIMIGEMRDAETIATALAAAETGHLVFSTLHTANVVEAIDRMVQYFPSGSHGQIRNELANSFRAIIAQRLFADKMGGMTAAFELLLPTDAVKNVIRRGENSRLYEYMFPESGMQTMEQAIMGLRNKRII